MSDTGFDPALRELCPDGSCIGVIGANGACKECGTVSPSAVSDPRNRGLAAQGSPSAYGPFDDSERRLCPDEACIGLLDDQGRCKECGEVAVPAEESAAAEDPPQSSDDEEFEARELCPDGGCIGLIGQDGLCRECGTSAT